MAELIAQMVFGAIGNFLIIAIVVAVIIFIIKCVKDSGTKNSAPSISDSTIKKTPKSNNSSTSSLSSNEKKVYHCPHCSKPLYIPLNKGNIKINCPKCNKTFECFTGEKPKTQAQLECEEIERTGFDYDVTYFLLDLFGKDVIHKSLNHPNFLHFKITVETTGINFTPFFKAGTNRPIFYAFDKMYSGGANEISMHRLDTKEGKKMVLDKIMENISKLPYVYVEGNKIYKR